jgi:hypothetical protein
MSDLREAAREYLARRKAEYDKWFTEKDALCEKKTFPSERQANLRLAEVKESATEVRVPIRSYQCDRCTLWHLTSWPAPYRPKPELGYV